MPIPSSIADLSATPSSNYPGGGESPSTLDDYLRSQAAIIRQVSDAKENTGVAATAITAERTAIATLTNKTLTSPTLTTPALGTPASGDLANCTFPTLNQNTSGTAANLSGTPTLPNGTTATTQTAGDNSTKLATTAYVATAVASGSGPGIGQTWQNMTGSRAFGSTYTNSTGKPIFVSASSNINTSYITAVVGGVNIGGPNGYAGGIGFIVPDGNSYSVSCAAALQTWAELR